MIEEDILIEHLLYTHVHALSTHLRARAHTHTHTHTHTNKSTTGRQLEESPNTDTMPSKVVFFPLL